MDANTIQNFVNTYLPIAQQLEQKYGMPAYASLSQWAHETNFGTSPMFKNQNNIAGIGASDAAGKNAMSFSSPQEAADYAVRVQMAKAQDPRNQWMNTRYAPSAAILADSKNAPAQVFAAMKDSGWAKDPNYNNSLMTRYQQMQPYLKGGVQTAQAAEPAAPSVLGVSTVPSTPNYGIRTAHPVIYPPTTPQPTNPPGQIAYKSPTGQSSYIPVSTPKPQSTNQGFGLQDIVSALGHIFGGNT